MRYDWDGGVLDTMDIRNPSLGLSVLVGDVVYERHHRDQRRHHCADGLYPIGYPHVPSFPW